MGCKDALLLACLALQLLLDFAALILVPALQLTLANALVSVGKLRTSTRVFWTLPFVWQHGQGGSWMVYGISLGRGDAIIPLERQA